VTTPLDVSGVLAQGRAYAEARMSDECAVFDPGTAGRVWNPATERYELTAGATVYAGRCRVSAPNVQAANPDAGGTVGVVVSTRVHLPADAEGVEPGMRVRIDSAAYNPDLQGRVLRVEAVSRGSQSTAQRLDCTEAQ
jgi:hypothetical protein